MDEMHQVLNRVGVLLERFEAVIEKAEKLFAPAVTVDGAIDWEGAAEAGAREGVRFYPTTGTLPPGSVLHVRPTPKVEGSYIGPPKPKRGKVSRDESAKFVEFYTEAYPRRVARDDAWRAWRKAVPKAGALLGARSPMLTVSEAEAEDLLLNRAEQWAKHWRDRGVEKQFIPYPASWLNDGTWKDAPEVTRG